MIRIAQSANPLEARHIQGVLEEHGIRASIQGEALWGVRGELPFTAESAPSIWVADEADAARAKQILAEHAAPANPTHCRYCGHDLHGITEPACPNCKMPFRKVGTWTCPECHEHIGTQFTHCWSCNRERGDTAETVTAQESAIASPCEHCNGTGYTGGFLAPFILFGFGLFFAYAALHELVELTPVLAIQPNRLVGRLLFALLAAACFLVANRSRQTPCTCTESPET
ncbi:MAG: DUF2007 domain-containing protein [Planctomycetes bacterium]|nr:DUF2007 domain-containing protein [Planctomycetota bacterium]